MAEKNTNKQCILAIDQGTSGTKVLVINRIGEVLAKGSVALQTHYLAGGKVEQEPEEIFQNVLQAVNSCLKVYQEGGYSLDHILTCGISNQRETFLVWDQKGNPLSSAIVWQCKRSIELCEKLKSKGLERLIKEKTGLIIDPYFSGTKLIWLYENDPKIKKAIDEGKAFFGTVDTWLLFRLTKGEKYLTDLTNASRTLFFNLKTLDWDRELLEKFGLTRLQLPGLKRSSSHFGVTDFDGILEREIPICAMIGDSHAAAFGEGCFKKGTAKATLGTGCSVMMNIGEQPVMSFNGMMSTICWSTEERVDYALEGVIVSCGATIEWLKNELGILSNSQETEKMAKALPDNNGVYLVPAFSGLGAPHWDMNRKGSIVGLTFECKINHIVRAALESIPFQIKDVINAMEMDAGLSLSELMIDGGIRSNGFVTRLLSDLLEREVTYLKLTDVSALGAAYLAGLKTGIYSGLDELSQLQEHIKIMPETNPAVEKSYQEWKKIIGQKHGI